MASEQLVIEHVAAIILDQLLYGPGDYTLDDARYQNKSGGWTFKTSIEGRSNNEYMLHEGVELSDERLVEAYTLAEDWCNKLCNPKPSPAFE